MKFDTEKNEITINILTYGIKIRGLEEEIEIPHNIFLTNNVLYNEVGGLYYLLSLPEEYLKCIDDYLSKKWFSFDGINHFKSEDVYHIISKGEKEVKISKPVWKDNEDGNKVLISYSNIIIPEKKSEQKLLLEKTKINLPSFNKLDDLKKKIRNYPI